MGISQTVIRNVMANWGGFAVTMVVSFFISPFVVHTLGNTAYGIWVLVASFTGYLGLLDFGMRPAIVKFVARFHELQDDDELSRVVSTVFTIFSIIAVVIVIASIVLSQIADRWFDIPDELTRDFRIIIILVGLNLALTFPFGIFNAILNGVQRFDLANLVNVSVFLVRSLFVVIFLKAGGGLVALGTIALAASLAEFLIKARLCTRLLPGMRVNFRLASRTTLRMIFSFSVYTFLIGIALRLQAQTDSIVISAFLTPALVTFFAIGNMLVEYLSHLVSNISTVATPLASALDARHDFERLRYLLISGTKYTLFVITPIGTAFLLLGKQFINLWMGTEYGEASGQVLTILMIGYFGHMSQYVAGSIFYGLGRVKPLSLLTLGAALLNLALSIILVKPYGINGVALGTMIPMLLLGSIVQPGTSAGRFVLASSRT